tara:strand:+ start:106 stop:873 length:768 start_codon:yes stop_codon:yes gene_type:complete
MPDTVLKLARLNSGPEIFHSLQGEGVTTGLPSVFIRASLCNLHCRWCDTDYTWNWQGTPWEHDNDTTPGYQKFKKETHLVELDVAEVARIVSSLPCYNVILTGGEPLLQDEAWCSLMTQLKARDNQYRFEVETNGTIVPSKTFDSLVDQYNISPKLANSGNNSEIRCRSKALAYFAGSEKSWFKFVIADEHDLLEAEELLTDHNLAHNKILLMPEGRDAETLQKRRLWLADACREKNYRFSDRLHIHLWGAKRGV